LGDVDAVQHGRQLADQTDRSRWHWVTCYDGTQL
jgi:hypothetical protein